MIFKHIFVSGVQMPLLVFHSSGSALVDLCIGESMHWCICTLVNPCIVHLVNLCIDESLHSALVNLCIGESVH